MTNRVEIEGTVKEAPVFRRNKTQTDQATFEICHEVLRGERVYRNWFRIAAHGALAKHVVEGSRELGKGLIPGDRVEVHGKLGARAKKCGGRGCGLYHNHWWINIDAQEGGTIHLLDRSITVTKVAREPRRRR